jgi:riboflavin kinase / FMN adenylyltransferase
MASLSKRLTLHRRIEDVGAPLALAIGNFDGVHIGHQAILAHARNAASMLGLQASVLTFNPLPREFFAKQKGDLSLAPSRLMSVTEKLAAFQRAGIEHVFMPRFDAAFAAQSPDAFIDALVRANVKWLMVGEDFRFGAKRAGDVQMLQTQGLARRSTGSGFEVEVMPDLMHADARVSSSSIRESLWRGDLQSATSMLGRPYEITGRVTHGKKLGRTLNFPTANVALSGRKPALHGVFAVECRLVSRGLEGVAGEGGSTLMGVANLGTNPVVSSENRQHLEVFLFDFSGDLYGKRLTVTFIEKIRDELKLASLDALVTQMRDDADRARMILSRKNEDERTKEGLQNHA